MKYKLIECCWVYFDGELYKKSEEVTYYDSLHSARYIYGITIDSIKEVVPKLDSSRRRDYTLAIFDENDVEVCHESMIFE